MPNMLHFMQYVNTLCVDVPRICLPITHRFKFSWQKMLALSASFYEIAFLLRYAVDKIVTIVKVFKRHVKLYLRTNYYFLFIQLVLKLSVSLANTFNIIPFIAGL